MTLRPGTFVPLLEIDLAVGLIGFVLSLAWGKAVRRTMDRDTVLFLAKLFGGITAVFAVIVVLDR